MKTSSYETGRVLDFIVVSLVISALAFFGVSAMLKADTYSGTISVAPSITHQSTTASTLQETLLSVFSWTISSTSSNAAYVNALYTKSGTLAAGATNTIDLYGALLNSFGQTVNMARVKGLVLCPSNSLNRPVILRPSLAGGLTNLWESGASTNGCLVRSGGCFAAFAKDTNAYPVADGTCDSVDIVSTATNSTSYSLYVIGE